MSYPRLSDSNKAYMVEKLMKSLDGKSQSHQDS